MVRYGFEKGLGGDMVLNVPGRLGEAKTQEWAWISIYEGLSLGQRVGGIVIRAKEVRELVL